MITPQACKHAYPVRRAAMRCTDRRTCRGEALYCGNVLRLDELPGGRAPDVGQDWDEGQRRARAGGVVTHGREPAQGCPESASPLCLPVFYVFTKSAGAAASGVKEGGGPVPDLCPNSCPLACGAP